MAPFFSAAAAERADAEPQTMIRKWTNDEPKFCEVDLSLALSDAGLASYTAVAESWCSEMGAAYLTEILEEFEELCDALSPTDGSSLSPTQCLRLRQALEAQAADDDRTFGRMPKAESIDELGVGDFQLGLDAEFLIAASEPRSPASLPRELLAAYRPGCNPKYRNSRNKCDLNSCDPYSSERCCSPQRKRLVCKKTNQPCSYRGRPSRW